MGLGKWIGAAFTYAVTGKSTPAKRGFATGFVWGFLDFEERKAKKREVAKQQVATRCASVQSEQPNPTPLTKAPKVSPEDERALRAMEKFLKNR